MCRCRACSLGFKGLLHKPSNRLLSSPHLFFTTYGAKKGHLTQKGSSFLVLQERVSQGPSPSIATSDIYSGSPSASPLSVLSPPFSPLSSSTSISVLSSSFLTAGAVLMARLKLVLPVPVPVVEVPTLASPNLSRVHLSVFCLQPRMGGHLPVLYPRLVLRTRIRRLSFFVQPA